MLRWPQLVRWIQWEGEAKISTGSSSEEKAKELEEKLLLTNNYADWTAQLAQLDSNHAEWLDDRQLYEFLKTAASENEKLSYAVKTGVW